MKTAILSALVLSLPLAAHSALYSDSTGDNFDNNGILDITSVDVQNTASDITFTINLNGNPTATDWGKYAVAINSVTGGDSSSSGNGWGRPISMPGMDYWIASWVDGSKGAELWSYESSWNYDLFFTPVVSSSSVSLTMSLASLGLNFSDSFIFDVFTMGGGSGDGANDALSNPNQTIGWWTDSYNSSSALSYTVAPVPEPTTWAGMIFGGGLAAFYVARSQSTRNRIRRWRVAMNNWLDAA